MRKFLAKVIFLAQIMAFGTRRKSLRGKLDFLRELWRNRGIVSPLIARPRRYCYEQAWPLTDNPQLSQAIVVYLQRCSAIAPTPYGSELTMSLYLDNTPLLRARFSPGDIREVAQAVERAIQQVQANWRGENGHEIAVVLLPIGAPLFDVPIRPLPASAK